MKLPEKDRAAIAHELLLSLDTEAGDDDVASAWQEEIEGRLHKIAQGRHQTHDWREAVREVRQELKKDAKP
jgi:hypothetical protein